MASYRRRLEQDLDAWIAQGLVPAESRAPILQSVGEDRRLDAATALAVIGAFLAGAAVIAFVAANWSAIPRIGRFGVILSAFLGVAGGAAWAHAQARPIASQALLCVGALVFAAAIGLTGQIFEIVGDPRAALRGAGLAAALLALAGRSPWTAAVALLFIALGDFTGGGPFVAHSAWPGWLVFAAPIAVAAALALRSQSLAHAAGLAAIVAVVTLGDLVPQGREAISLSAAIVLAAAAAGARSLRERIEAPAATLYGWFVWGALVWFGASGFDGVVKGVPHSVIWLMLSAGVVALGRHDRHGGVTASGVLGLFAAGAGLLFNLGVGLLTSAAVFAGAAIVALLVAFAIRRRRAP